MSNVQTTIKTIEDVGRLATLLATFIGPAGPIGLLLSAIGSIVDRVRGGEITPEQGLNELESAVNELGASIEALKAENAFYFTLPAGDD